MKEYQYCIVKVTDKDPETMDHIDRHNLANACYMVAKTSRVSICEQMNAERWGLGEGEAARWVVLPVSEAQGRNLYKDVIRYHGQIKWGIPHMKDFLRINRRHS